MKCCFTGHRPKNLPWGYNESGLKYNLLYAKLYLAIRKCIKNGYTYFLSGMAMSIDMICAEIVINMKNKYKNVELECVLPCLSQSAKWSKSYKDRYNKILDRADKITIISENYTPQCMMDRNKYMVDNSNMIIAVYNGSQGGTEKTIRYAKAKNLEILLLKI